MMEERVQGLLEATEAEGKELAGEDEALGRAFGEVVGVMRLCVGRARSGATARQCEEGLQRAYQCLSPGGAEFGTVTLSSSQAKRAQKLHEVLRPKEHQVA